MEITFELTAMLYPSGFDPNLALTDLFDQACSHLKDDVAKVTVTSIEAEGDDIYHVTLTGAYQHLFHIFQHLHHYFTWKFNEDSIMNCRFSRIIF